MDKKKPTSVTPSINTKKIPPAELIKNLDGDSAVRLRLNDNRIALVDTRTVVGLISPSKDDDINVRSLLITSWGVLHTGHTINELEDLLYPSNFSYDE
jgi:hypothetical protein